MDEVQSSANANLKVRVKFLCPQTQMNFLFFSIDYDYLLNIYA